eukprot:365042-Chlamydomonas_euryale.AAC.11
MRSVGVGVGGACGRGETSIPLAPRAGAVRGRSTGARRCRRHPTAGLAAGSPGACMSRRAGASAQRASWGSAGQRRCNAAAGGCAKRRPSPARLTIAARSAKHPLPFVAPFLACPENSGAWLLVTRRRCAPDRDSISGSCAPMAGPPQQRRCLLGPMRKTPIQPIERIELSKKRAHDMRCKAAR